MKRLLPCCLQALLFVCLLVANATAQDESSNKDESSKRDVSELSVDELRTYGELKEHLKNKMRAYTARYRAASKEDKMEVFKTRPSIDVYRPLLSKFVAEGTERKLIKFWLGGGTANEVKKMLHWWASY